MEPDTSGQDGRVDEIVGETPIDLTEIKMETSTSIGMIKVVEALSQLEDRELIAFLEELDSRIGSWDFTAAAALLFTRELNSLHVGEDDPRQRAVDQVTEFLRQLNINPAVKINPDFYTVWTDPAGQPASLNVESLGMLLSLAALGLERIKG